MEQTIRHIRRWSVVLWLGVMTAALVGLLSIGGTPVAVISIHGETLLLHNHGVYRYDTQSVAIQAIAQDAVTLLLWGTLFAVAWRRLSASGERTKLMYAGLVGYSLYAYMSYSFLSHFNELFLLYVFNMSLSLYLLVRCLLLIRFHVIASYFERALPIKRTVAFLLLVAVMLGAMWLGRILPGLAPGAQPFGLETYHTLIIQAMDLGFIVPLSILSAYYLAKRKAVGYAMTAILLFKGIALFTAVATMAIVQGLLDDAVNYGEVGVFLCLTALAAYVTYLFLRRSVATVARD